ncbi:competence protein ComEC [Actinopolymorpha cephalotaxi]|uniref:Competence protein ComEC n=1 Tax=Actinopolymorpha cephalotaxi TaxID=504797 RepID=A0A1I2SDW2_9ACTN|nr:ComEC/Rec2 family competence protein [Actinopolymorpha cephalotaxi]NYH83925.1 competence protein ComEC [Actinopolymorpha cephalotaxi]SFG50623.1 competence protein ComEC [Actinopolymorpha cephalotaxi]
MTSSATSPLLGVVTGVLDRLVESVRTSIRVGEDGPPTHQGARATVDARLVPVAVAGWLCTLVVPVVPPVPAAVGAVAAAAAGVVLLARPSRRDRALELSAAVACLGAAVLTSVTLLHVSAARGGPVPELAADASVATTELRVRTDPRVRSSPGHRSTYVVLEADVLRLTRHGVTTAVRTPVVVTGPAAWSRVEVGQRIRAVTRFAPTEQGERVAAVLAARSPPTLLENAGPLDRAAGRLRAGLRAAVAGLPANERGLVPALVVGDVSRMPEQLEEDFRTAGLSHLTAVSGTNLTILLAFVLGAARWAGVRSWGLPLIGAGCAMGFVVLARPEPSVLRAAAMGVVGLAGLAVGSRRHGVPAVACAVLVLLLVDPWLGRTYGFALSVLATAGIVVLGPPFSDALARWLPRFAATAVGVPLAAQVACTPVVAVLSASVSVVAVVANMLVAPAVTPATVLGIAATLVSPVSVSVAAVPGHLAGYAARWIVEIGTRAARLPGASLTWPSSALGVAVLTLLCVAAVVLTPWVLRRRGVTLAIAGGLVAWIVHPVQLPVSLGPLTGWPPAGWVVVACDVGQGDALVLRAGARSAVVVDTGPDPVAVDRCLTDLGVRQVPYVLLTHFHADHTTGLPGVARGRVVGEIGFRPGAATGADARRVRDWAGAAGIPAAAVAVGEERRAGALTWKVLGPAGRLADPEGREIDAGSGDSEEGAAENDSSVVILARVQGISVLMTGDIEPTSQRRLLSSGADLQATVLKVPHHGSRYQDPDFLRAVGARIAIISVGADNDYGHPAPSTIATLASTGSRVARTDENGAVAVVKDGAGLGLVARSPPK